MGAGQRPLYEDDNILLTFPESNKSASAAIHGPQAGFPTNICWIGTSFFTVAIRASASAAAARNEALLLDFNNSNLIDGSKLREGTASSFFGGQHRMSTVNSTFSANWVSLTSIAIGQQFVAVVNTPVRWIRLRAAVASTLTAVPCAYVCTDTVTYGV